MPFLSITENVLLPCRFSKQRRQRASAGGNSLVEEAQRLLKALDLDPADFSGTTGNVGNLSVGQQQRVAAARALIGAPPLILADEPTAALDVETRDRFIALLLNEARTAGSTVFVVSHDLGMVPSFDRDMDVSIGKIKCVRRVAASSGGTVKQVAFAQFGVAGHRMLI